jgi:hypothetical protein
MEKFLHFEQWNWSDEWTCGRRFLVGSILYIPIQTNFCISILLARAFFFFFFAALLIRITGVSFSFVIFCSRNMRGSTYSENVIG